MARTKASVGAKISSGKSSKARCCVVQPASTSGSGSRASTSGASGSGGNPVCPRETPKWQRPITNFFIEKQTEAARGGCAAGSSSEPHQGPRGKSKRNIIESDDECDLNGEKCDLNDEKCDLNDEKCVTDASNKVINENYISNNDVANKNDDKLVDGVSGQTVDQCEESGQTVDQLEVSDEIATHEELNESLRLEPLDGDQSHKIEEYYNKSSKGKGLGKKSARNKENTGLESNRRLSAKRDLHHSDDDQQQIPNNKKVKRK